MSEQAAEQEAEEEAIAAAMSPDVDEPAGGDLDEPEPSGDVAEQAHADEAAVQANADAEKQLKQVSGTADRYVKKLVEILGPELGGYAGCELCEGFPPGLVILEAIDDERRELVKRQIGLETLEDYLTDEPFFTACPTCGGRGAVRTGSKVPSKQTQQCRKCNGRGFVTPVDPQPGANGQAAGELPLEAAGEPARADDYDEYGTPSWHPDFGKMVHRRDVPISHWAINLPTG